MNKIQENKCIIQNFTADDFYRWAMANQYLRATNPIFSRLTAAISHLRQSKKMDAEIFTKLIALTRQQNCLRFQRSQAKNILLSGSAQIETAISEGQVIAFDFSQCTLDKHFFGWLNQILNLLPTDLKALDVFEPPVDTVFSLEHFVDQHDGRLVLIQLPLHALLQTEQPTLQLSLAQLASKGYGLSTPFLTNSPSTARNLH